LDGSTPRTTPPLRQTWMVLRPEQPPALRQTWMVLRPKQPPALRQTWMVLCPEQPPRTEADLDGSTPRTTLGYMVMLFTICLVSSNI